MIGMIVSGASFLVRAITSPFRGQPDHGPAASARCGATQEATAIDPSISPLGGVFNMQERQLQVKTGVPDSKITKFEQFIRTAMPEQHMEFYAAREVMYMAVENSEGVPSAGVLVGPAGFMSTPDDQTAVLDLSTASLYAISRSELAVGKHIGFLGLEHETRRRNRINGRISQVDDTKVTISVDQSFGNCPKYIQKRPVGFDQQAAATLATSGAPETTASEALTADMRAVVSGADTFFIGSTSRLGKDLGRAHGVDVSHRGGPAGFVQADEAGKELRFADYKGNNFYMSLGNIAATGVVSLVFFEYETGAAVSVTGCARIDWDDTSLPGALRTIVVDVDSCTYMPAGSVPFKSGPITEWSPANPVPASA